MVLLLLFDESVQTLTFQLLPPPLPRCVCFTELAARWHNPRQARIMNLVLLAGSLSLVFGWLRN